MEDEKGDSIDKVSEGFDLEKELSTLVAENIIPSRIAERLGQKLKEKKVTIKREQLYMLANKISEIINDYYKSSVNTIKNEEITENADMQKLVETIGKLEERITNIETGKVDFYKDTGSEKSPKIVTTEDIQVSEKITFPAQSWELNPLTKVPSDPESIIVLMKWLQYLVDKCGHAYLPEILDYYVDIGWISEDAKISLLDYSNGITEEIKSGETSRREVSNLPSRDHIQSLIFIQKLKGNKFDKHFIDRIDGELARIAKKLDTYRPK